MTNGIPSETNGITSEATLLPCPFCGGEARAYQTATDCWSAECSTPFCGCEFASYGTEAEAAEAWNTRAQTVFGMTLDEVRQMMKRDAEREWTCKQTQRFWTGAEMICSKCAHQLNDATANYCPNCGAKVVER